MKRRVLFFVIGELLIWISMVVILEEYGVVLESMVILSIIQLIYLWFVAMMLLRPITSFSNSVKKLLREESTEEDLLEAAATVPYMDIIKELVDLYSDRRTKNNNAQIFDKQTELRALQSQINPHFLYNTLDSIRAQALLDDNTEIAGMVEALASFFRYSISGKGNLVTLRDELANINNYMKIQRYRFNNRFSLEIQIDEEDEIAYDYLVPRLIIQPIVENAIFHGLEERLEDGRVTIEIIVTEQYLIIMVSDNGQGISPEALQNLNERIRSRDRRLDEREKDSGSTGIALPNVHKRIQLLFGEACGVNVYSTLGQGTDVEITLPVQKKKEQVMGL